MKKLILLLTALIAAAQLNAQVQQYSSAEILQGLKKLNTLGSVLYIAAHPDDENTRLLAYLSKEKNLRTGYLSLTRGDGGQNLIGKEQGEPLGLIRTNELLGARSVDGAEQFFTRANDFGFSKNPEETFTIWNKDSILADVVWTIRMFKPDVIICRFPTTGEGGHGHHTASAILALEAFDAAADPKRFPQQLKYTTVWQAKRIFWNTFNFGGNNTTSPDQLQADVGGYNALLGKSYGEIAADSRSMHKSQGFGSAKTRGSSIEYFKQLKGDTVKKDLFEGIDTGWKRIAGASKIQKLIDDCIKQYDMQDPAASITALTNLYKMLQLLPDNDPYIKYWKTQKTKETENLLVNCAGLFAEATAADYTGIPGNDVIITVQALSRNNIPVKLNKITWPGQTDTTSALVMKRNELYTMKHKEKLAADLPFSNPYWLTEPHSIGEYTIKDQLLIGKPQNDPAVNIVLHFSINGLDLQVKRPLVYKFTDPVKGEIYRPFEVLPPATVNIAEKVYVFADVTPKMIHFTVKANANDVSGTLQVNVPEGWTVKIEGSADFSLKSKGEERTIAAMLTPGKNSAAGSIKASLKINGTSYSKSITRIEYDHIPYQFILSDASAKITTIDLKRAGTNIAYIPGAGDDVPACLKQAGYNVTILTDDQLAAEDLSKYDAIVTGVRAYNTNERLQVHYSKLMEYVEKGGNLIVQYNTNNRIGPLVAKIAPYPFTITRDRVTDEKAEVRFVNASSPALTYPNKITADDFKGWIQERGIYFASELDKNYQTVLSMNDPNEKPNEGSLVIAKYGKGNFVYTGLVFFRELPAGVPGAYRLFANLLALPGN